MTRSIKFRCPVCHMMITPKRMARHEEESVHHAWRLRHGRKAG